MNKAALAGIVRFAFLLWYHGNASTNPYRWSQVAPAAAELMLLAGEWEVGTPVPTSAQTLAQRTLGKGWSVQISQIIDSDGKALDTYLILMKGTDTLRIPRLTPIEI